MSETDADPGLPPLEFHQRAQDVFAKVLAAVRPEQLEAPTPCEGWDVRTLIDHVIQGNVRVQQRAGRTPDALPDDLVAAHAASAAGAHAVFAAPDGLTRIFELPIGDLPGAAFLAIRGGDAVTHAWDLAVATGQPTTDLDPIVAAQALASAQTFISDALRGEGRPFGSEQPCDPSAPIADRMAAFLGRRVGRPSASRSAY